MTMVKRTFEETVIDAATTLPIPEAAAALTVGLRIVRNRMRGQSPMNTATPLGEERTRKPREEKAAPAGQEEAK